MLTYSQFERSEKFHDIKKASRNLEAFLIDINL